MPPQESSPKSGQTRIVLGAIIVILIIGFIAIKFLHISFLKGPQSTEVPMVQTSATPEATSTPEVDDGLTKTSGKIVEILQKPDSPNKFITVVATDSTGKFKEYKFYISGDTETTAAIEGGKDITISFVGEPSLTDYVLAKKIK
jgi:hypothetical protein